MNFSRRVSAREIMDDGAIGFGEFAQTLRQLEAINRVTFAYRPAFAAIEAFLSRHRSGPARIPEEPLRILDVGCGYGDLLRATAAWAKSKGVAVSLTGLDKSPWAARAASRAGGRDEAIVYLTCDVFDYAPSKPYHVVLSSQFLHHLSNARIVSLLRWMRRHARYGFLISDLHRHPLPYYAIAAATRLLPFNRLIRHDAPLSVAKAFTRTDWMTLAFRAGLDSQRINLKWHWPFRWSLTYDA